MLGKELVRALLVMPLDRCSLHPDTIHWRVSSSSKPSPPLRRNEVLLVVATPAFLVEERAKFITWVYPLIDLKPHIGNGNVASQNRQVAPRCELRRRDEPIHDLLHLSGAWHRSAPSLDSDAFFPRRILPLLRPLLRGKNRGRAAAQQHAPHGVGQSPLLLSYLFSLGFFEFDASDVGLLTLRSFTPLPPLCDSSSVVSVPGLLVFPFSLSFPNVGDPGSYTK